ncbi:hypothetical protein G4B88_024288 [Cannabis sativa]|uniref:Uncharacterized protein n=1 Tax=Cannabis sativa TaxID=3483 RepID=A0A7J6DP77_CANSA|nr:hypothetical protein G4B88_024288 [Cannabis sativa]
MRENKLHGVIEPGPNTTSNQGLCGEPLSKKCVASLLPPSSFNKNEDSDSGIELDWKFILAGLVSGLVIGVSLGEMLIPRTRLAWFYYARGWLQIGVACCDFDEDNHIKYRSLLWSNSY